MTDKQKVIAVIPARSGSKRLPDKNKLDFCGLPLVVITIQEALKSSFVDRVVVSSDDPDILSMAREQGVEHIERCRTLASDNTSTIDVVLDVVKRCNLKRDDLIVLLQPTSPLRNGEHIDASISTLFNRRACGVISVCETDHSPLWSNTLPCDFRMTDFISSEIKNLRSQDLPKYYRINGAIYISKVGNLIDEETFLLTNNLFAFEMEIEDSVDIDTQLDFELAELIYKKRFKNETKNYRG